MATQYIPNWAANLGATFESGTYADIKAKKDGGTLVPGGYYQITDFATIYDQPDFDGGGSAKGTVVTKTGATEPLVLLATKNNEFALEVYSPNFPKDKISYDIDFDTTEVMSAPAKGRITERIDDLFNRTDYDHRVVLFKRYESAPASGIFNSFKDNGEASQEFLTFGANSHDNYIGNYADVFALYGEPFLLSNNVFGEWAESNKTGDYFKNNTLGNGNFSNTFGNNNLSNILGDSNSSNTFGNENELNILGENNNGNTFGYANQSNIFGNFNRNNIFGDNITSNTFGNNNARNDFKNNIGSLDFTLATHTKANYQCTVFLREDLTPKLSYINNSDVLTVVSATA